LRKGRGTRSTKFHEEFGYETLINESVAMGEILALSTLVDESNTFSVLSATSDSDSMHFHQAMRQKDAGEFLTAARLEFQTLLDRNIVELLPAYKVPRGMRVFSTVWAMRRKRRVKTQEIYKYKARLNLDGSQMKLGRDYDLTYAPVASWESGALYSHWSSVKSGKPNS
jgi:hypothetical protein